MNLRHDNFSMFYCLCAILVLLSMASCVPGSTQGRILTQQPVSISTSTPGLTPQPATPPVVPATAALTFTPSGDSSPARTLDPHLFLFGVNYPWFSYGNDFGQNAWGHLGVSANVPDIDADFKNLSDAGVKVVRWFVFADGRASPEFAADGSVTGLDNTFFGDLDMALEIAQRHDIRLVLVLLDFHWLAKPKQDNNIVLGGHADVIVDPKKRESFYQNALIPLLKRYGQNPYILAWEVMNEPEWAVDDPQVQTDQPLIRIPLATMQNFVSETTRLIHASSPRQFTTLGGASRRWWKFWETVGVDICQFHYYDWMEDNQNSKLDFSYSEMDTKLPCIVGEFPTSGSKVSLDAYYKLILKNQYAGAFPWSLRSEDSVSNLAEQLRTVQAWSQVLEKQIVIPLPPDWKTPTPLPTQTPVPSATATQSPMLPTKALTNTPDPNVDSSMYGFETRDDEWVAQDYDDSQAVTDVQRIQSPLPVYSGKYALQLDVNLVPSDGHLSKGETFVEVLPFPPVDNSVGPYDLGNSTVTCQVYLPADAYDTNKAPWIGLQVFVKDDQYRSEYGTWTRVYEEQSGKWLRVILKPRRFPAPDGYMIKGFDPSRVVTIGVKIGVDNYYAKKDSVYSGPIFIDACTWK